MTPQEAKQRLERIWKYYTSAYDIISEDDVTAFDMAINSVGAIDQIQWERDLAIKQLHDLGYGLGEKPREEAKKASGLIERQKAIDLAHELIVPNEYKYGLYNQAINNYCVEIMRLPSAQPEQRWIPCSERLPEEHIGFYLVTVQKRRITALNVVGCDNTVHDIVIARWDYDRRAPQRGYHWCKEDKVIAWMPLPEAYKEGDSNERT